MKSRYTILDDPLLMGLWGLAALGAGVSTVRYTGHDFARGSHGLDTAATRVPAGHAPFTARVALSVGAMLLAIAFWILSKVAVTLWRRSRALASLPGPGYNWLVGTLWVLQRRDMHRWLGTWAEQYGSIFKIRVLLFHIVVLTDPLLAMHVLNSSLFDKWSFMYSALDPLLNGPSILTGPTDDHWKAVRKSVAPAFSTIHMREALRIVVDRSLQLASYLQAHGPEAEHNLDKLLLRESMDVIGQFGFQMEMKALSSLTDPAAAEEPGKSDVDVLIGATIEVEHRMTGPHRRLQLWKPELWHGAALLSRYNKQVSKLLQHVKHTSTALREGSFAKLLLKTKDSTGQPLSDSKMTPEVAALFFAGIDTTGHTNTWLLYLLTQNPAVEARMVEELDAMELLVTPERPDPRSVTYDDLKQLTYLQCVVKEVLRMYPPVGIGQVRISGQDVTLANKLLVPKGTLLWVPHYAMFNVSHNWEEPHKFQPERWLKPGAEYAHTLPLSKDWYEGIEMGDASILAEGNAPENGKSSRRPKRYFPFAAGPRDCVGQSLAKVSLVATIATLLQRFTFRLAGQMGGPEGVRAREQYTLVTGIADGMWMHAIPRPGVQ